MDKIGNIATEQSWQKPEPQTNAPVPEHVDKFVGWLQSKQFAHEDGFTGFDHIEAEHYGKLVIMLDPAQIRQLCFVLFQRHGRSWMPNAKQVVDAMEELWPPVTDAVKDQRRVVSTCADVSPDVLLITPPPQTGDRGYERFLRMQWELKQRPIPIPLAQRLRQHCPGMPILEREELRKRLMKEAGKYKDKSAWLIFCEEKGIEIETFGG